MIVLLSAVHSSMRLSAGWGALVGGLLSLVVLGALVALRARRSRGAGAPSAPQQEKRWPPPVPKPAPPDAGDDRDPDLIPATYGKYIFFYIMLLIVVELG